MELNSIHTGNTYTQADITSYPYENPSEFPGLEIAMDGVNMVSALFFFNTIFHEAVCL